MHSLITWILLTTFFICTHADGNSNVPLIIAHRGASGKYPSHTKIAYEEGALYADFIECDLALTKDLILICLHDSWLSKTTNISDVFDRNRKNTRNWNGSVKNDYFSVDFTLEELKSVGKNQERSYRDQIFNGQEITTFGEYLDIALKFGKGIYPETKNPDDFNRWLVEEAMVEITFEDILMLELENHAFSKSGLICYFQSFSIESITFLSEVNTYDPNLSKFVYLSSSPPSDLDLTKLINARVLGLGLKKLVFVEEDSQTNHIKNLHPERIQKYKNLGFTDIHVYTLRNENEYLLFEFEQDFSLEIDFWLENFPEVDGYFTDFPKSFKNVLENRNCSGGVGPSGSTSYQPFKGLIALISVILFII